VRRAALLLTCCLTCACANADQESAATTATEPVAVIALAGGATGGATRGVPVDVTIPAAAAQVRFDLAGITQPADELTAELAATASGAVRRWPVDAASGGVSLTVPIYAVPAGEHVLTLWQGDADVVARYFVRVSVR
jgi:hypothetical protein